jgi:hypothetical protein
MCVCATINARTDGSEEEPVCPPQEPDLGRVHARCMLGTPQAIIHSRLRSHSHEDGVRSMQGHRPQKTGPSRLGLPNSDDRGLSPEQYKFNWEALLLIMEYGALRVQLCIDWRDARACRRLSF